MRLNFFLLIFTLLFCNIAYSAGSIEGDILRFAQRSHFTNRNSIIDLGVAGHSIASGYNLFTTGIENSGNASGDYNNDISYKIKIVSGINFYGTNFGVQGAQAGFCFGVATNNVLPLKIRWLYFLSGVNSIANGNVFDDFLPQWDHLRNTCVASNTLLIVGEEFPWETTHSNAIVTWNARLNQYAATNTRSMRVVPNWAAFGEPGNQYKLNTTYSIDGQHINTNGEQLAALLLMTQMVSSVTVTSSAVSWTAISNAVDTATNGNTIIIPFGTNEFQATLNVDKGVWLRGNGMDDPRTRIADGVPSEPYNLFKFTMVANDVSQITGIDFVSGSRTTYPLRGCLEFNGGTNFDGRRFRVGYCRFDRLYQPAMMQNDSAWGVFDHNWVWWRQANVACSYITCDSYNGTIDHGNGSFADDANFNTSRFVFTEDNVFVSDDTIFLGHFLEHQKGARAWHRHNIFTNGIIEGHGLESADRGTRAVVGESNQFWGTSLSSTPFYFRGGELIFFNNTVKGYGGGGANFPLLHNRGWFDGVSPPYGPADGRNPWDVNNAGNPHYTGTASSAGSLTVTKTGAGWTNDFWVGAFIRRTSGKACTISRSGSTVTVTATAHGYSAGQYVAVWNCSNYQFNNRFLIQSTPDANTFTYFTFYNTGATSDSGLTTAGGWSSEITANTSDTITFRDPVQNNSTVVFTAGDTFEINFVDQAYDQAGRTKGTLVNTEIPTAPGSGNDQTTTPCYEWGNTNLDAFPIGFLVSSGTRVLRENEHFFNDTVKPTGFSSPYIYPHELVTGVNAPATGGGEDTTIVGTRTKKIDRKIRRR